MASKYGGKKAEKTASSGPVSGGVHTFKEKTARPDPMPKVHTTKRASSK